MTNLRRRWRPLATLAQRQIAIWVQAVANLREHLDDFVLSAAAVLDRLSSSGHPSQILYDERYDPQFEPYGKNVLCFCLIRWARVPHRSLPVIR